MNKVELINAMAEKSGLAKTQAEKALGAFIDSITEAMGKGEKVALIGFGTFEMKEVPAKEGINPATKEKITIPASKKPVLKFGKAYKDSFNK